MIGSTSGSSGFGATGDQLDLNPLIGSLQDNGGSTFTHALLASSPAIDKGYSFGFTTDQRGRGRPYDFPAIPNAGIGGGSDIGAFESQPPTLTLTGPVRSGNNMVVSFSSDLGQRYRIERKDVLAPGVWTTVADNIAGTGGIVPVADLGATILPKRFYRGQVLP